MINRLSIPKMLSLSIVLWSSISILYEFSVIGLYNRDFDPYIVLESALILSTIVSFPFVMALRVTYVLKLMNSYFEWKSFWGNKIQISFSEIENIHLGQVLSVRYIKISSRGKLIYIPLLFTNNSEVVDCFSNALKFENF